MNFSDKINQLRVVSENVDQYISNGTYMLQFDSVDVITEQILLNECFKVLVDELAFLGIIPNVPFDDLISDYYNAEAIISIRKIVDKNNLLPIFRSSPEFKEMVVALVGNKENSENVYFCEFLDIYQRAFPGDSNINIVRRLETCFNSNNEFKNYILALDKLSIPHANIDDNNRSQIADFLLKIVYGRVYFEKAVNAVLKLDPSLDRNYLQHAINLYDVEKIQGHVISDMAWAVMTDPETLHENLQLKQRTLLESHYTSTSHHIEYYITNCKHPTTEQLVELTAHHFEPDSTEETFNLDIKDMLNVGSNNNNPAKFVVFTEDDIHYILRIKKEIAKLYNENRDHTYELNQ